MADTNGHPADRHDDDVAVVGQALRLPGARTADEFWANLEQGRSSISEVPGKRWRAEEFAGDPRRDGDKTSSVWGGFVADVECFDADFFRVSPREARMMDPQQRMALELSWHAIEDAGYRADRLAGSRTGVFMGVCHWDYAELVEQELDSIDSYYPTGAAYAVIANRVSHHFDFRGPSVVNDTACASSLVSVQQAVQALAAGDCDLALAGGVNLVWSPRHFVAFSKAGMLSPDGRSKVFDAAANGYVRGEGCGVLVLKRVADARRDGDPVHAIIKAIGTNHGGRTSSLTVTNPDAQAQLIIDTYRRAGIDPASVSYVEAHGTGTPVGDPIEVRGLKKAFAELGDTSTDQRCGLGSVKTNIGHLEGAAGIAGILKVIAAMRHRRLPATVGFERLNPLITLTGTPFRVVDRLADWSAPEGRPLRAGVSSFGFAGTNAHAVLESVPPAEPTAVSEEDEWLPVSSVDEDRLRETCAGLATWARTRLAGDDVPSLADVAHTLRHGRVPMSARVVFRAHDLETWAGQLEAVAGDGALPPGCLRGQAEPDELVGGLDESDLAELAARWLDQGRVEKFIRAWVHGLPLDWSDWPATGRRIHLPGSALARTPFWFRPLDAPGHPSLGDGREEGDGWTFPLTLRRGQDVIRDHVVNGNPVVPGVAVLGLVLAAARLAGAIAVPCLRNVGWIRPLVVTAERLDVRLRLVPGGDGFDFEVLDDAGTRYVTGRLVTGQPVVSHEDPVDLRTRFPDPVDVSRGYAALRASGVEHGPALRGLDEVSRGEDGVLARILVPAQAAPGWLLHPVVLDSALQAVLALGADESGWRHPSAAAVPFALEELTVFGAIGRVNWAVVREGRDGSKVDVDVHGEDGALCVRLRGYTSRPLAARPEGVALVEQRQVGSPVTGAAGSSAPGSAGADLLEVRQVWRPAPAQATTASTTGQLVVLDAVLAEEHARAAAQRLDAEILPLPRVAALEPAEAAKAVFDSCYQHLRALLARPGPAARTVLVVAPGGPDDPVHAPLAAVLKSLHKENPAVRGGLVLADGLGPDDVERFESIVRAEAAAPGAEIAYDRSGRRLRRETVELSADDGGESLLRAGGVYWITGGAGGVGRLLAAHLCERHGATVVLSGRRAEGAEVGALRERFGDRIGYQPVDVTDAAGVRAAAAAIRERFGRLDGVFHAAGVLDDGYLVATPVETTAAVLAPKLSGTVHLDVACREHGADFLLLFGSVAGAFGSAAQTGYAAANAFLDAYAVRAAGYAVRVVDWPLWAEGGMRVDTATDAYLRKTTGTVPVPTTVALAALERALRVDAPPQRAVLHGEAPKLRRYAGLTTDEPAETATAAPARSEVDDRTLAVRTEDHLRRLFAELTGREPEQIRADQKLERYGIDSLIVVGVTSRLEDDFGSLPKTLFFEHVDLRGVAGYLLAEHRGRLQEMFGESQPVPEPTSAPLPARTVERPRDERDDHDIAVIGMAGRYPGADTLDEFWDLLSDGRHSFEPVPRDRWRHDDLYFGERDVPGKTVVKTGTFIRDIDAFDPRYFSISQRQAELLSPEVRLLLQAGVTALEDAGYSRETIQRRYQGDVGVLVGSMNNSYSLYGFENMLVRGTSTSGSEIGVMANMLSYFYGFTGPSMFLDTMCASSATCVHQAVRMLRAGDCRMAVVGGINLMLHPHDLIATSQAHFTSKTADLLRSYGVGADGTVLGEGVGMVVLKPLTEAVADGDHVYGVIRGTGMTNAGVRNGFTVPSPVQQARAIEKALDDAGADARTISYLEGHGSATSLGDPIEIRGATTAFRRHTADRGFCALGSVKSNVAHLLSGSGIVGLTKVLLQLKHRTLVRSLHSETLSPAIDFADTPFVVQRERAEWQRPVLDGQEVPRRAGVTSIGAGGANVHIVVEEHDAAGTPVADAGAPRLLVFSATTPQALGRVLRDLLAHVRAERPGLDALAFALQTGKNELPCRLAFAAGDAAAAEARLTELSEVDWTGSAPVPGEVWFTPSTMGVSEPLDEAEVTRALAEADLAALAACWTAGADVDWNVLWPPATRPAKLSLPGYPFERVRCWYPGFGDAPSVLNPIAFARREHPWVGVNESDLTGIRYRHALRGDELLDYVYSVRRERRYVTAALLDGALALAELAGLHDSPAVRDARWAALPAPSAEEQRLEWRLDAHRAELRDADGAVLFSADLVPDDFVPVAEPECDMSAPLSLDDDEFYAKLGELGVDARPYARVVEGVNEFGGRLLVRVVEPAACQDPGKRRVRIPAWVLAGLVQGVQHLCADADVAIARVGSVVGRDLERTRGVLLERTGTTFQVRLLDENGRVLGRITDAEFGSGPLPDAVAGGRGDEGRDGLTAGDVAGGTRGDDGRDRLTATVRDAVAGLLKADPAEVDLDTHFPAFGFDSITLASLAAELGNRLGADLSPAVFFQSPNIRDLVDQLAGQVQAPVPPSAPPAPVPTTPSAPEALSAPATDDGAVAIIGIAGRFPGADDPDVFWQRLRAGTDLVSRYPGDRFDGRYANVVARADFPKFAGLVDGIDRFDADFFAVSRLEAELMDPQQRLALETAWTALEDGGYPPVRLPGNTGVFFGVSGNDYHHLLNGSGVAPDGYTATGNSHAVLANRISFLLDVHGPSEPIDTACSSSLVALHRAVESIRSGRCDMAVAGGVNLLLSVDTFAATQAAGMLSPDGRCKTFSADADGYVRAEGAAAVLLKPLAAALRDGDAVRGVVLGSAENHGGRAASLTAPNAAAQAEVVQAAMRDVAPDTIGYVEAHGTGTALGDPVEVDALATAYRNLGASADRVRALGSVKANIGHAEAAAGLAGVLKVLQQMRHGELLPVLHCDRLNPHLRLDGTGFEVLRDHRRWQPVTDAAGRELPLRAGVSSFGFGGVNAHVVLEAPPARPAPVPVSGPQVIVLSARDTDRLRERVVALHDFLRDGGEVALADLAFTLQVGREEMEHRLGFTASSVDDVVAALEAFLNGTGRSGLHTGSVRRTRGAAVRRDRTPDPAVTAAVRDGDLDLVTASWCEGRAVVWEHLHPAGGGRVVPLPTYPFARERYWVPESAGSPEPVSFDVDARAALLEAVLANQESPDALNGV
ncbi:SDR family NAD(P)-dependent oxidoreductase [Lentzea tibetensis]|uniref:SDR family NAD(P)-dependent oxidoreductase n=1 Tax=Lentzea tibetensis TaxID=2591470 RepID=A0A563EX06_9PSEU|nr:SDR family NAD(P)-dependent oxidoreductase [Lentzea tibetensis]TWP52257.1 SDR family NAD(P)-dependent oxidoreductase [Lentzea tibetensis]